MATSKASAATPKQISEARELLKELRAAAKEAAIQQRNLAATAETLNGLQSGIITATINLGARVDAVISPATIERIAGTVASQFAQMMADGLQTERALELVELRRRCEYLEGVLNQTVFAPRLIDRLRWAFLGYRRKETTNGK